MKIYLGRTRSSVMTALAPVMWGTTYVVITELLPAGRPVLVSAVRVVPAGAALAAWGAWRHHWRPRGAEWARLGVLGAANFALFFPLLAVAVYRLPGGVAAGVGGLQPLFVLALSAAIAARRPRPGEVMVGVVAAVGVGLVVVRPGAHLDPVGVLAAVGANLSFALGVVLTKRLPAPIHRLAATGWQLLLSGIVLVPLSVLVEGTPPAPDAKALLGFAYLTFIATALAYVLWFQGIGRLPTLAPPLLGLAAPVTGATLGLLLLDQTFSPLQLVGFVVTIAAIAYGATAAAPRGEVAGAGPTDAVATTCRPPVQPGRGGRRPGRALEPADRGTGHRRTG